MGNRSDLKYFRNIIMKNGIAHIIYHSSGIHDIIHPFSVKDKELLSEGFLAFLEKYRSIVPSKVPIVLEITGVSFSEKEKELIDTTIWDHLCMNMTAADNASKKCIKRCILYLLYTVLSAVLIFAVANVTDDFVSNFAYMIFWFFGYRLLIFLIIDSLPLWKDRNWYRQLASLKLVFSKDGITDLNNLDAEKISEEVSEYSHETYDEVKSNNLFLEHVKNKGTEELECKADSLEDLILMTGVKGRDYISDSLASLFGQIECFFDKDCDMTLKITGKAFNEEEQSRIQNAIRNYYGFRLARGEVASKINLQQICIFGISVIISSLMVVSLGTTVDVASAEFINMMFWFFGDYLLEFILIIHFDIRRSRKILETCKNMKIIFD